MNKLERLIAAAEGSLNMLREEALRIQYDLDVLLIENEQLREERQEYRKLKAR